MKKNKYCKGCGILLQNENLLKIGFTTNLENEYCMRCFRLKNYGDYESVSSNIIDYDDIISSINKKNDLVLYVVDILNLPEDLEDFRKIVRNDILLILNKRDLLPLSVKDEKIIDYLKKMDLGYQDIIIVSTEKNIGMDTLMMKIKKYQKSKNVYVVGYTNAGKSSLISKIIKNYGNGDTTLSIAPLPSTTLNKIIIPIDEELTLIDTPGIIDNQNMIHYVEPKMYKKLNSKKEIKPKTYQLMKNNSLLLGDLVRLDYVEGDRNSLTFYLPNEIKIRRSLFHGKNLKDLAKRTIDVKFNEDLVISGLGFIKIVAACRIELYLHKDVRVFTRKSMI